MKRVILKIGHRARQGKDLLAQTIVNIIEEERKLNSKTFIPQILSWSDPLYKELYNKEGFEKGIPLFRVEGDDFIIRGFDGKCNSVIKLNDETREYLKIPFSRLDPDNKYWGMTEKDSLLLQWWGTDYRRKNDNDYWVKETLKEVEKSEANLILIPGTRFVNELEASIEDSITVYVDIYRIMENGDHYVDPLRDPNHPSESQLDLYKLLGTYYYRPDFVLNINDGDFQKMRFYALRILKSIKELNFIEF